MEGTIRCAVPGTPGEWWMVLDCASEEIGRYYRSLFWLDHNKALKLQKPAWSAHVTVVRAEDPPNKSRWYNYNGERVWFSYGPGVNDNHSFDRERSHFWVNVVCPRLDEIRTELGLAKNPDGIYHMTVGVLEGCRSEQVT